MAPVRGSGSMITAICSANCVSKPFKTATRLCTKVFLLRAPIPPAGRIPAVRLLFIAFECVFTFIFWTLRSRKTFYNIREVCPWDDLDAFEYEGLCTHNPLFEGVPGDFDLTDEQRAALATDREQKRLLTHREGNRNWHQKKMAEDYANYMDNSIARVQKSRANNPEMHKQTQQKRIEKAKSDGKHSCNPCNKKYGYPSETQDTSRLGPPTNERSTGNRLNTGAILAMSDSAAMLA
ncbi:hypothetical protein MRB53_036885 [Persea americana]|nr:hypothetical protein MRB53_036885 [Persea americana]